MDYHNELLTIKRSLARMDEKLTHLNNQKQETWVKVTWITRLTGWNNSTMRQAREQGLIKWRKGKDGGYEYLLQSVPDQFVQKKTA